MVKPIAPPISRPRSPALDRQPAGNVALGHHLAPPQEIELLLDQCLLDAEGGADAGASGLEAEHQAGIVAGAAAGPRITCRTNDASRARAPAAARGSGWSDSRSGCRTRTARCRHRAPAARRGWHRAWPCARHRSARAHPAAASRGSPARRRAGAIRVSTCGDSGPTSSSFCVTDDPYDHAAAACDKPTAEAIASRARASPCSAASGLTLRPSTWMKVTSVRPRKLRTPRR